MKKIVFIILICIAISMTTSCAFQKESADRNTGTSSSKSKNRKKTEETLSVSQQATLSTPKSPAAIGQWVETKRYSSLTQRYHTVYLRIVEIVDDSAFIASALQTYNAQSKSGSFPLQLSDGLSYRLIKYEVMFPADFPEDKDGIPCVSMRFFIRDLNGNDYITDQNPPRDLAFTYDISQQGTPVSAGDTFSEGTTVFMLPADSSDYLIENNYYINQECFPCYFKGQ